MNLSDTILDHLRQHGPCSEAEIHQELVRTGRSTAKTTKSIVNTLLACGGTEKLPDGRWDVRSRRLVGAVLTTRPRSLLRDSRVWVHRDLEPFDLLHTPAGIPLTGGGFARRGSFEIATLVGPDGWLPDVARSELLAFSWDGTGLSVTALADVPTPNDPAVQEVLLLLRLHALAQRGPQHAGHWTRVVLSALQENPHLLSLPLPPLTELLPLSNEMLSDPLLWEHGTDGRRVTLTVPARVHEELERRAYLLGDNLPDYASMLLSAATDRLRPPASRYEYGRYDFYDDEPYDSDVVSLADWK